MNPDANTHFICERRVIFASKVVVCIQSIINLYMYTYLYMWVYIYMYLYKERERETQ